MSRGRRGGGGGATRLGRVRDLGSRGDGVVETDVGVVLVPGALPGERVRVRVLGRRGGTPRGRLVEVLEPSADRVEAACALADRCGGCPWMPLDLAAQRAWKRARLERAVGRPLDGFEAAPGDGLGQRTRARLHAVRAGGRVRLGYHAAGSHEVVDVARCPVLAPALEGALAALRAEVLPALVGPAEVRLALGGPDGAAPVVALASEAAEPAAVYSALGALVDAGRLAGAALRAGGATSPAVFGDPTERREGADGAPLEAPPGGFSQAQEAGNLQLARLVGRLAHDPPAVERPPRVLELYAGHGNLTVALAPAAAAVVAVELDPAAAEACRRNVASRGLRGRVEVRAADAAAGPRPHERFDVLVLDPPRRGAGDALGPALATRPRRVVVVSCDPGTLGADLAALRAAGFHPDGAWGFDLFPHTPHVEAVVRLTARPG